LKNEDAVFVVFGFVLAQLQRFQTCSFAKALPKTKNPRAELATVLFKPLWRNLQSPDHEIRVLNDEARSALRRDRAPIPWQQLFRS
jgi:hypothetical protein